MNTMKKLLKRYFQQTKRSILILRLETEKTKNHLMFHLK